MDKLLKLNEVSKIYYDGDTASIGIQNINLEFSLGEFVAITGESGSGKSTLLNVLSLLDNYEEGDLLVEGKSTIDLDRKEYIELQNSMVSFVFQEYNLIESYSVLDNCMLPLIAKGVSHSEAKEKAYKILKEVGLYDIRNRKTIKLSGGEKQRTVIARALICDTKIFACDEPTGNLDSTNSKEIVKLFDNIKYNKLILYVTHDFDSIKDIATRHIVIKDGRVLKDEKLKKDLNINELKINKEDKKINKFALALRNLSIANKNLFKMPKMTILSSICALVFSFSALLSIVGMSGATLTSGGQSPYYFDNINLNTRVISYSNNQNKLDLSKLDLNEENVYIDRGDFLGFFDNIAIKNDGSFGAGPNGERVFGSTFDNGVIVNDDLELLDGKKPSKDNEIAIIFSNRMASYYEEYKSDYDILNILNKEYEFSLSNNENNNDYLNYKITGFLKSNDFGGFSLGFSIPGIKRFEKHYRDIIFDPDLKSSNSLFNNNNCTDLFRQYNDKQDLKIEHGTTSSTFSVSPLLNSNMHKIYVPNTFYGERLNLTYKYFNIEIDKEDVVYGDYESIIITSPYVVKKLYESSKVYSIYFNNTKEALKCIAKIHQQNIVAILASTNVNGYEFMAVNFSAIFMVISMSISLIAAFYILTFILSIIYKKKKRDYTIFTTLSFSKKDIFYINNFEFLTIFLSMGLLVYFISFGVSLIPVSSNNIILFNILSIFKPLSNNISIPFLFLFLLVLCSFFTNYKVMKKLNSTSRAKSIKKDGESL